MQNIKLVNNSQHHAFHPPPSISIYLSIIRTDLVQQMMHSLHQMYLLCECEKAAIIWEREIRNGIYSAALWSLFPGPISPILPDTSSSSLITIRLFIIFTKNKDQPAPVKNYPGMGYNQWDPRILPALDFSLSLFQAGRATKHRRASM